ncbi:hypothetical protein IJJ37_02735, partial [Candidatus Saccharibacteria bacterium]|nr:hypothetical protein [Candidatus Saccharibacteria bacterium]
SLSTNNYTGYTLTLAGSSTTTTLNTTGGDTLSSITANTTATDFSADNATGKANNNKWGIMPSSYKTGNTVTNNNATTFFPSPSSSNTITMDETSTANASSAKSYTIGLGVRADYTKTAGTYNNTNAGNTITIAYVANPTNYAITYNKGNTEDIVDNLPSTQGGNVSATSIALSNTIPTRTGYDFKGWCTVMPTTSNNNDSCAGTIYNADGANTAAALTFPINRTTDSNTATLYAMWNIKTFAITVQNGGNTMVTGSGTYQYGEEVTLTATPTTSTTCVSYGTSSWTSAQTTDASLAGTGALSSDSGTSITYTVGLTNDTITATSTATNNTFTITFKTSNASSITFNGTNKSNNTTGSYTCGNYTISGNYSSGYEFSGWSRTGSGGFTTSSTSTSTSDSSSTASTYFRVQGTATITLTGKSSKLYMWNATSANCGTTMWDNRDGTERSYTTAMIGNLCWMTKNLMLGSSSSVSLTSATSNVSSSGYTLRASSASGFNDYTTGWVYNAGDRTCSSSQSCYGYYSYAAATAGSNPSSGNASYDICPKGWRLPTQAEYNTLYSSYNTDAKLVASPWHGVYSGTYNLGSFVVGGSDGYYWSSTAYSSVYAYHLYFNSSSAGVIYNGNGVKCAGSAVRCVAKS